MKRYVIPDWDREADVRALCGHLNTLFRSIGAIFLCEKVSTALALEGSAAPFSTNHFLWCIIVLQVLRCLAEIFNHPLIQSFFHFSIFFPSLGHFFNLQFSSFWAILCYIRQCAWGHYPVERYTFGSTSAFWKRYLQGHYFTASPEKWPLIYCIWTVLLNLLEHIVPEGPAWSLLSN